MSFFDRLIQETQTEKEHVTKAPVFDRIREGSLTVSAYQYFLGQAYHHVKHTAPLMMACGGRLPERLEFVRKALVEYIEEEYGHHEWILNDIEACGGNRVEVTQGIPDFPIRLMVSYLYDLMHRGNPMGLFGMVYVLEGTSIAVATPSGKAIQESLGLPNAAFSYLYSHGELDQDHFEFFKDLMNQVTEKADQDAIVDTAKVCFKLYGDMLHDVAKRC